MEVLLEVDNWESLANRLEVCHHTITTNCWVSLDYASCVRRTLVEIYCDAHEEERFSMKMIVNEIAQVLNEMSKRRQAGNLERLSFSGEYYSCSTFCCC